MLRQLSAGVSLAEEEDFTIDDVVDDDADADADVVSVISCCESITLNISWGTLPNKSSGEARTKLGVPLVKSHHHWASF